MPLPTEAFCCFSTIFKLKEDNHFSIVISLASSTMWNFPFFCFVLVHFVSKLQTFYILTMHDLLDMFILSVNYRGKNKIAAYIFLYCNFSNERFLFSFL